MALELQQVASRDSIEAICQQMQPEVWGDDNEMTSYQPESLQKFLESGGVLILAKDGEKIVGAALGYIHRHPDGNDSLYVDELDTHPDYRRQGVATHLMNKAGEIAKEKGCTEVWVSTETTNETADKFYCSLDPYEVEPSYIYTYKVK